MQFSILSSAMLVALLSLPGCSNDSRPAQETPRAVKLTSAGSDGAGQTRFTATVRQEQRSELAFENGGRIKAIYVDVGDHVRQGQLLAQLDSEPTQLRLQQAQANASSATAELRERQIQLEQQSAMFADGATSQATLTAAKVALEAAQGRLRVAESDRKLAQRALRQADIRAPFDGNVVARMQQPHIDVPGGQAIIQIEGQDRAQVVALLPPKAAALSPGDLVAASRTDDAKAPVMLRLRSVASGLDGAATLQAIFDVQPGGGSLRSGESLLLSLPGTNSTLPTLPLAALLPHQDNRSGTVFVYVADTGKVERRKVWIGAIEGDRVQIREGLRPGERVVSAGAAFLNDGQQVVPFASSSKLSAGGAL
ncbi:efflux RND transporter periplasmic adaptor subunit [Xanthomonas citri pv. citri]|nr:efflux RND transporter periplasmic adaptor subunit [Xanthomonas citri pv. citri]QYF33891.1 efflux RND transporter periplasmic adaptor subunit [Xanthomonas citri pv. citri]